VMLYSPVTRELADAALIALHRHVPVSTEVGVPFAARLVLEGDFAGVGILTRQAGWLVSDKMARRIRRLDSELGELWDLGSAGRFDICDYRDGVLVDHVERVIEATA
jgi:hypothetical protein